MSFTPEETRRLLEKQGVPREKIAAALGTPFALPTPASLAEARQFAQALENSPWPLRFTLPWSCLISDNHKYHVLDGKLVKTAEYKMARSRIAALVSDMMGSAAAGDLPLQFEARVWVPNNQRRDVHNFGKCALDSMKGIVFTDDHWLHDVRWIRAGVDVDHPRAEITIRPYLP